jgi:hypothetical protein
VVCCSTITEKLREFASFEFLDTTGWTLRSPTAVSQSGNVIVGWGINPAGQTEGWIADLTPTLGVQRGTGNVVIWWSTNVHGFVLRRTTSTFGSNWTSISAAPAIVGTRYAWSNKTIETQNVFRLSKP